MRHKVCFGDVVRDLKENVDRTNNPYEYYVAGDHMDTEELRILRRGSFTVPPEPGPAFTRVFKIGHVLYGSRRTYLKKIAVADFDGICANTTFVLETKDESMFLQRLLPFLMNSDRFTEFSIKNSKGSVNPYILFSDLAQYEFELPPMKEQIQLSNVLWAMIEAKNAYLELIEQTDQLVKSQFIEMFGDDYPRMRIVDVCDLIIDGNWIESKDQSESGIRLVQTGNVGIGEYLNKAERARYISEETFNALKCTEIFEGDVLVSRLPDPIGRACELPELGERMITAVDCTIIRLKKQSMVNKYFIAYTKSSAYAMKVAECSRGATRQRISRKDLENILLPVPPLELQNQFADFVRQADKSKFVARKAIQILNKNIYNQAKLQYTFRRC